MSEDSAQLEERAVRMAVNRRQAGRLWRLVLKELREILRDRRTIVTLVVMPLLIYPLLAVVFQRFLFTSLAPTEEPSYVIGVDSVLGQKLLLQQLQMGESGMSERERHPQEKIDESAKDPAAKARAMLRRRGEPLKEPEVTIVAYPDENLDRHVADSSLHLAVVHRRERTSEDKKGLQTPLVWELIYRAGSPTSEAALHFVESRLHAFNRVGLDQQLKELGVAAALPAATERQPINFSGAPTFSLAALIPLILVLMTVTGAVYPAIDLTAGERERGTLETLIAAPVPRLGLLLAKYVAVLVVALLTAVVNLTGMTITAHSTGLAASLFGGGMTFGLVLEVLLLLALFAAFFSAILLALTSYARSFKEAQAYIIPLMLMCLVPGIVCLIPSLEFAGWMAVTPLINIVMLTRDLLEGSVKPALAAAAVCSTVFYIGAAIALAARIFGTDAILYGSPATWSDLVRRPSEPQQAVTLPAAMLGLALMFPAYFVLANNLARSPELLMDRRLAVIAIITAAVFGGIPLAIATVARVKKSGLGLNVASWLAFVGAAILGLSLWPAAHEIYLLSATLGMTSIDAAKFVAVESIVDQFRAQPLWLILVTMAVVPAVCEEFCFRGFVFGALRARMNGVWAVVISALLFGVFHEVLTAGRLMPSTFLGLVLGFVRLRSGSIWPGIVLHVLHNGFLLTISCYRDELMARGWDFAEASHLPPMWHAAALVAVIVGGALLMSVKVPTSSSEASSG
ncbi:MAG: ABC transporter permease subunit/CPBP intramembrane protease [Pirellulales bacterium]